jgi:hypothetical protein
MTSSSVARTRAAWALVVLALLALSSVGLARPAEAAGLADCPCSLWSDATVPAVADFNDPSAVELGVQFSVDVAAPITGLRFYKAAANTGTHVGSLWTADGTLLARATFVNETAGGWQRVLFSTPVDATPGTRYVASYHTPTGHYSVDSAYFAVGGYDNGILHAPGRNPAAPNGLFVYTPVPAFPTGTFNDNNYWVDVIVGRPAPTVTGLTVSGAPASLAKGLTRQLAATATYSDGTTADVTSQATWTSSKPTVATVSATGLLKAAGVGSATVTAALGGRTAPAPVSVTPATMTSVSVTPGTGTLRLLGSLSLKATAVYTDGTTVDVTERARWTSSNPFVVLPGNIFLDGWVLGLLPGTATVTATVDGLKGTAAFTVRW